MLWSQLLSCNTAGPAPPLSLSDLMSLLGSSLLPPNYPALLKKEKIKVEQTSIKGLNKDLTALIIWVLMLSRQWQRILLPSRKHTVLSGTSALIFEQECLTCYSYAWHYSPQLFLLSPLAHMPWQMWYTQSILFITDLSTAPVMAYHNRCRLSMQ